MTLTNDMADRIRGCIFGQAVGDALGLGTEFMTHEQVRKCYPTGLARYEQIVQDRHRSRWERGSWTDDTDMMLCIAEARKDNLFDPMQVAANFKKWFKGTPMGIGRHTYDVLVLADYTEIPYEVSKYMWEFSGCKSASNGALMRTSVMGTSPLVEEKDVIDICRLTHYDPRCTGSCVMLVKLIQELIFHGRKLEANEVKTIGTGYDARICEYLELAQEEDPLKLAVDDAAMGYTLKTLAVALWHFWRANDFEQGLLSVVNMGGDADTNAAVTCALLGAEFGYAAIPAYYVDHLLGRERLGRLCEDILADLARA